MKVQVRVKEIVGEGWVAIIFDREAEEAELVDGRFFPTMKEARDAAARNILHAGGFEDGELVSEVALRLGFTFKAFTDFLEASDFLVSLNTGIRHGACWGELPKREWTLDYLGDRHG